MYLLSPQTSTFGEYFNKLLSEEEGIDISSSHIRLWETKFNPF